MGERRRRYAYRDGVARTMVAHDDMLTTIVSQDIERILEEIAFLRTQVQPGSTNYHAAKLPVPIYEDLKRRGIIDDEDAFKRWLNSSDAKAWRIYQGQL
jgi:hypothetical protein